MRATRHGQWKWLGSFLCWRVIFYLIPLHSLFGFYTLSAVTTHEGLVHTVTDWAVRLVHGGSSRGYRVVYGLTFYCYRPAVRGTRGPGFGWLWPLPTGARVP